MKVHPDTVNSRQIKGESYKAIDKLQIGDRVLSADEHTGELSYRPVTELFVHDVNLIHRLTYKEGLTIETTWNHPFWVQDQGWTEAKDLHAGERSVTARSILKGKQPRLQTVSFTSNVQPGYDDPSMLTWDDAKEGMLSVARVEEVHRADKVYNIEVEGNHTYFVTEEGVLVHNYVPYGNILTDMMNALAGNSDANREVTIFWAEVGHRIGHSPVSPLYYGLDFSTGIDAEFAPDVGGPALSGEVSLGVTGEITAKASIGLTSGENSLFPARQIVKASPITSIDREGIMSTTGYEVTESHQDRALVIGYGKNNVTISTGTDMSNWRDWEVSVSYDVAGPAGKYLKKVGIATSFEVSWKPSILVDNLKNNDWNNYP